eukprot:s916_g5.t1
MVDANTDEVYYIFTDASFCTEQREGGIGGVLIDHHGTVKAWFGAPASRAFCESFMEVTQEQAIGELESFAVLVAFHLCGPELKRKHVVVFLDNEGCRYLILKGYASNANLQDIVHGIARLELQWCMLPWYARVPTECNLADYPSREKAHEMLPETLRVKVPAFENVWPNRLLNRTVTKIENFVEEFEAEQALGRPFLVDLHVVTEEEVTERSLRRAILEDELLAQPEKRRRSKSKKEKKDKKKRRSRRRSSEKRSHKRQRSAPKEAEEKPEREEESEAVRLKKVKEEEASEVSETREDRRSPAEDVGRDTTLDGGREPKVARRPAARAVPKAAAPNIRAPGRGRVPAGRRRPAAAEDIEVHPSPLKEGELLLADEAFYYGNRGALAGEVVEEKLEEGKRMVALKLLGTTIDGLLQWGSQGTGPCRCNLCGVGAPMEVEGKGLVYVTRSRRVTAADLEAASEREGQEPCQIKRKEGKEEEEKEKEEDLVQFFGSPCQAREEEEEEAKEFQRRKRRAPEGGEKRGCHSEGPSLETNLVKSIQQYRPGSSDSEENVQRDGTGSFPAGPQKGPEESTEVHEEAQKQFFGKPQLRGIEGRAIENRADGPFWGRIENQRSGGEVSRTPRGRGFTWDQSHGFIQAHQWGNGPGAAYPLQPHRSRREDCPGAGYQPAEDQRLELQAGGTNYQVSQRLEVIPSEVNILPSRQEMAIIQKERIQETRAFGGQQYPGTTPQGKGKNTPRDERPTYKGKDGRGKGKSKSEGKKTEDQKKNTSRTIDYRGEEVKTAKSFSWANIGPALPREIGIASRESPSEISSREIKKDAPLPESPCAWRVYLDNYDLLEKFPLELLDDVRGTLAPEVEGLRESYASVGMPRHTGKSVTRQTLAEVQGAQVDGIRGVAYPKGSKLVKYVVMVLMFCQLETCSQRQAQVICGGLVYFSTFRRQLLGSLNLCWSFIESFNTRGRHKLPIPPLVKLEILRCVCLVPLCRMDFRLPMEDAVTCSDASTTGRGMCCSTGLSPAGQLVAAGTLRPDGNKQDGRPKVPSVGLFDGVGCLRVALDLVGANVAGHISVEKQVEGHRVGVSGLNADRRGALNDERSNLFVHVVRIRRLFQQFFPWCAIHVLMESVASMDQSDKDIMSDSFGDTPLGD